MAKISVAMAVYNGEKFIREQIDSILCQLRSNDELVISYDISTDDTYSIITSIAQTDCRIVIIMNQTRGVKGNFNNALNYCSGDYIFVSDQDDIWEKSKIQDVLNAFENTSASLVIHDGIHVNNKLEVISKTFFNMNKISHSVIKNFIIAPHYSGCCMAFTAAFKKKILPFPNGKVTYDHWIGMMGELCGTVCFLEKTLILHRLHGNNVTVKRRNLPVIFKYRMNLLLALIRRMSKLSHMK